MGSTPDTSTVVQKKLATGKATISAALRAIPARSTSRTSFSSSSSIPPPVPGLPEAVAQLLASVRHTTTALALAFKPPILPDAVNQQLEKLCDQYGRLASCAVAVGAVAGPSGATEAEADDGVLAEEWRDGITSIGQELERFLGVLENGVASGNAGGGSKGESPYLVHTGMIWEAIDRFAKDMSRNEVAAVVCRLEGQREVFKDAWTEFKEFLEDQEGENDEEGEDGEGDGFGDEDDEWGELERAMQGSKMSQEERNRAEAAKPLLGLHQLLHATVPRYAPLLVLNPDQSYRPLLDTSSAVLASFDAAVSAMYPTQDEREIENSIDDLSTKSRAVVAEIKRRLDAADQSEGEGGKSPQREACRSFLDKWDVRLGSELVAWQERRLSLSALKDSL